MDNYSKFQEILTIYNGVQKKILLVAEASMPLNNFKAFRKLVLDEFGHGGARDKLREILHIKYDDGSKEN